VQGGPTVSTTADGLEYRSNVSGGAWVPQELFEAVLGPSGGKGRKCMVCQGIITATGRDRSCATCIISFAYHHDKCHDESKTDMRQSTSQNGQEGQAAPSTAVRQEDHPWWWTKENHLGNCSQSCLCCRSARPEAAADFDTCWICDLILSLD